VQSGEPLAYVLGEWDFYGLTLQVSPAVLIPRPETEQLADAVLHFHQEDQAELADIGTGSGALALALKTHRPGWRVTGVDLSANALSLARENGRRLGLDIQWIEGDGLLALQRAPNIIVANPPYIDPADPSVDSSVTTYEPHLALFAAQGTTVATQWIRQAAERKVGHLWMEHGLGQGVSLGREAESNGFTWAALTDITGRSRFVHLWKKG
jgi:release factor glutamine methyltransferase